eukprot:11216223-Lingulodinium_polyedra.AAC.1
MRRFKAGRGWMRRGCNWRDRADWPSADRPRAPAPMGTSTTEVDPKDIGIQMKVLRPTLALYQPVAST